MSTDPDLSIIMETVDDYKNELPEGVKPEHLSETQKL